MQVTQRQQISGSETKENGCCFWAPTWNEEPLSTVLLLKNNTNFSLLILSFISGL